MIRDAMPKAARRSDRGTGDASRVAASLGRGTPSDLRRTSATPSCSSFLRCASRLSTAAASSADGKAAVDLLDHFRGRAAAAPQRVHDLRLTLRAMREVTRNERIGLSLLNDRPMPWEQAARPQRPDSVQRVEIRPQVSATAGGNHDGSAGADEIAAVDIAVFAIDEREVVRRMARREESDEGAVAGRNRFAVGKRGCVPTVARSRPATGR